jgi:hypothetical protein
MQSPSRLAIIDASIKDNHGIVDTAKVEGYPSFLLYRNGQHVLTYGGLRTESHFVEYMMHKNTPLITSVESLSGLMTFIQSHFDPTKGATMDSEHTHYFFVAMMPPKGTEAVTGDSFDKTSEYTSLVEEVAARNDNMNIHFISTGL